MSTSKPIMAMLAFACFFLSGCNEKDQVPFVSHQFSVEVPEFYEVTPEESFALFASIKPNLDARVLLQSISSDAPEKIQNQINRWLADSHIIKAHQFGHGEISVNMLGPGSGMDPDDKEFQKFMQEAIIDRVRTLVSEATAKAQVQG